jgi:hypothetical protein
VADPFTADPGVRLYRTGDLGRYRADGMLEYLGRCDHQVKLRGFRIELGEIESVLCGHPAVRQSVVLMREDAPGDKRLVAYVVKHVETTLTVPDLQLFLQKQLPEYMIPSSFMLLERLPLTPNGKVDRKTLPAPDASSSSKLGVYAPPRSATEEVLAEIWCDVLAMKRVGIDDDFFELGGHSLLATKLLSRIRTMFGVQFPIREVFDAPTIAGQAEKLAAYSKGDQQVEAVARAWIRLSSMTDEEREKYLAERRSEKNNQRSSGVLASDSIAADISRRQDIT